MLSWPCAGLNLGLSTLSILPPAGYPRVRNVTTFDLSTISPPEVRAGAANPRG